MVLRYCVTRHTLLCSSRKYPYSPHRRDWKFLGGEGLSKAQNLKLMYEAWLEFPERWREGGLYKKKSLPWGRYEYFLEPHIVIGLPFWSWKEAVLLELNGLLQVETNGASLDVSPCHHHHHILIKRVIYSKWKLQSWWGCLGCHGASTVTS